ncbi:hypothetical protein GJ744_005251 [Endocarpon pusillum]|uniref:Uncharacterized protein n=1 Tax=Endocarpon pusillum TaxID=364733 RepID=A0A8H7A8N6_9EURO|nr:hypothetical protein GJ744_005251 [Endocarpon pusillum]
MQRLESIVSAGGTLLTPLEALEELESFTKVSRQASLSLSAFDRPEDCHWPIGPEGPKLQATSHPGDRAWSKLAFLWPDAERMLDTG